MGVFDFVKDAGKKIGLGRKDAEEGEKAGEGADEKLSELRQGNKLLRLIRDMKLGIEDPKVEFDDGVATVWGTAPSQVVKENVILVMGNTEGVARVDDRMEVEEEAPEATFYTVRSGDTLSKIAKEHYGDASRYPEIFEANRPMLSDPDKIYPGQVLRIPQDEG
jgi:nucleoid-associated protein YgaU